MLKKRNMVKRSYYFPISLVEELQKISEKTGLSVSDIIRLSVKDYIKKQK